MRRVRAWWALALALWLPGGVVAESTPAGGVSLRIETGSHGAPIRDLAADRQGRYVVTVSDDKSARVWDGQGGRLLQVFRPPSGAGNDGRLFAVSMRPDGVLFAAAGWSPGNDLYLVARTSGALLHRITGLPNVVTALAFAPDGRHLAVGLWGDQGVRLFAVADDGLNARELQGAVDIGGEVRQLAWSPDGGRLAVSSGDGALRLYALGARGLELSQRQPARFPEQLHGLAFSPDGRQLLVGAADQPVLVLLDGQTLAPRARLTLPGQGGFNAVAWSPDGRQLLAAGSRHDAAGNFTLCRLGPEDTHCEQDAPLSRDTVTRLLPLADGRLLYAAADPLWGALDGQGTQPRVGAERRDYRGLKGEFALAADGGGVVVGQDERGLLAFDLRLPGWGRAESRWRRPADSAGGTQVEDWFESSRPRVNGRPVGLEGNELALAAAVAKDGRRVALGTNFRVLCLDEVGTLRWSAPAPGTTWKVNLSGDGRWLVAAFSDGSIRWYRMSDGAEEIALLPHPDGRRWVAWTPSGHFAVSPGGEELLGWQVERGAAAAADFFPASRFRDGFYRPELMAAVLDAGDVDKVLRSQARPATAAAASTPAAMPAVVASRLPPVVRILSPSDGQGSEAAGLRLRFAVRSEADAPVEELRVRINGVNAPLPAMAELARTAHRGEGGTEFELPLSLPETDADILVFAGNRYGFSPPAVVRVTRPAGTPQAKAPVASGPAPDVARAETPRPPAETTPLITMPARPAPPPVAVDGSDLRPALYVLAVGISHYANPAMELEYAAKDAGDLSAMFTAQEGRLYRKVVTRLVTDDKATRDGILDGLEWIRREMTARDVGVVFLAGHGVNDRDGTYYFLPHDTDVQRLKRTAVIFTEVRNTLVALPGKALFFVDTCHAGNILGSARTRAAVVDATAAVNELATAENGVIVFTATTGRQLAQESSDWGNGAFTKALLEGLSGKADFSRSGRVTHKALDFYVSERVKALTEGAQSPVTIVPAGVPDFPLAIPPGA